MVTRENFTAETRKQRLLREALVDVRALVPVLGRVGESRPALRNAIPSRPITPREEPSMHSASDKDEGRLYRVVGTVVPAAILFGVAAGVMMIGAQTPVSTTHARLTTAVSHGVPDASVALDANAVAEPLPPTF
jgi:hypothetical protein